MTLVRLDQTQGVARITLANPARCNALTVDLLADLNTALNKVQKARVVVLQAEGRHFSTGGDIARLSAEVSGGNGPAYAAELVGALNTAILGLASLPFPVLAQVQGAVTGGALGLMLAADLVVMTPNAFVQPWYGAVGFAPDGGWTALLPDRIGARATRRLLMLDTRLTASAALEFGLVDAVDSDPDAQVDAWLETLLAQDPDTISDSRRLTADLPRLASALEAERAAFVARIDSPGAKAGMSRFLTTRSA